MMERKVVTQLGVTVPNCLTYLLHNSIYVCTKIKLLLNIQSQKSFRCRNSGSKVIYTCTFNMEFPAQIDLLGHPSC